MPDPEDPAREHQSEAVKSCAESVMESNPDMDKSTAFAICQDMENKGQLKEPDNPDDTELSADTPPPHRFLQADFSGLEAVRRTQEGDDVRYENLVLIGEGEWTDAFGNTEYYSRRALQTIAENPEEMVDANHVDVNHEYEDQLLQVGHIDVNSLKEQNGLLLADVVIYGDKTAGKDIIADMDRALESDGAHGAGGFSVEIPEDGLQRRFNSERGIYELTQFKLAGGAIVTQGASGPANFDQQFAERAVALSAGEDGEAPPVRVLSPGDTTKAAMRHSPGMDPVTDLDDLSKYEGGELLTPADSDEPSHVLADGEAVKIDIKGASMDEIRDALNPDAGAGAGKQMEGGNVAAAIDEYIAQDGSPEDGVDEFLQWANANLDMDMDALEAAAADYLAQSGAEDLSETPVSEFMAFLDEQGGEAEGENPEDEEPGEDMGSDMAKEVDELKRALNDREETIRELAERVESLEDEPDYGEGDIDDANEDVMERIAPDLLGGLAQDGDYYGR